MSLVVTAISMGIAALAIGAALFFAFRPRRGGSCETLGDEADLDPPRRVGKHPALGAGYRRGPIYRGGTRETLGDEADLDPAYRQPVILRPRDLEHVNILRRRDNKSPMSAAGFRAAIVDQARQSRRTGTSSIHTVDEWLAFLINVADSDVPEHRSFRVAVDRSVEVQWTEYSPTRRGDPYADLAKSATQGLSYGRPIRREDPMTYSVPNTDHWGGGDMD